MSGAGRRRFEGYLFVGPFLLLYLFLLIYPLLMGIGLSFNRADPFGARQWVGLDNYARLAADPIFHQALLNTFELTLLIDPALTLIPVRPRSRYCMRCDCKLSALALSSSRSSQLSALSSQLSGSTGGWA